MVSANVRIEDVKVGNQNYRITFDNTRHFPHINQLGYRHATGVLAEVLEEVTGKPQLIGTEYVIEDEDEMMKVIISLGHKFSRRKQWKRIFNHYSFKISQIARDERKNFVAEWERIK